MRRLAALAAAVAAAAPAVALADDAPATRPIDLATALDTALRQNDVLAGEQVDVEAADATVAAAGGADDLQLTAEVGALTRRTQPVTGPFFQETDLDDLSASVAVWKPLSSGGRIGLALRDDVARTTVRIDTGAGMPVDIDTTIHGPRAELTFVQPLLRGRGRTAWHADRRRAAAERDAQAAERDRARAVLVHDVTVAYWELAYAARAVAIEEDALALARGQLAITQARADVGRGGELEVAAVEQAIAAREAALLGAQQQRTERALDLRVLMALDDGDARELAASDPLDGAPPAPATDDALARAIAFSPDLHAIGERARAAEVDTDVARLDVLPALDLVVRGGPAGNADQVGDALSQLATFDSFEGAATLTLTIPLGNHAARGRLDAAKLRERRLDHAAKAVRGELTAAVQRALDAIDLAARRVTAADKAASLARRNVDLEVARWQTGAGTNFDVMARQDQAAAADAALARARADQRIAIAGLAYLTGDAR